MGSRKDLIKRSLGITEYPWSSDDDLEEALGNDSAGSSRPSAEPVHNAAAAPRLSGPTPQQQQLPQQHSQQHPQPQPQPQQYPQQHQQQQQPTEQQQQQATARRNQARLDRDLFWSIITSPQRIPMPNSRSRSSEIPYVSRVNHVPAPELRERSGERREAERRGMADIQRILAFKRLTRNLGSMRHRSHIAGVIPVSRVNPGVIVPSEANSGIRINRHLPIRRFVRSGPWPSGPLPPRSGHGHVTQQATPPYVGASEPRGRARARDAPDAPDARLHPSHDEINNNPLPSTVDSVAALDEGNVEQDVTLEGEVDIDVTSESPTVILDEDSVAIDLDSSDVQEHIDAADEEEVRQAQEALAGTSAQHEGPAPTDQTDGRFSAEYLRPADDPAVASTSGATSDADPQQANQGTKRKRRDSEESLEPNSVKEFNQNLLRLLECPVCLEWMEPPMSQCRRGHLVCGRCRARLVSCPVCRTTFSSVRNRAMEGVAELLRYPCRHGCGREVRLRRRAPHEASCAARKYQCPAPVCADAPPLPRAQLAHHFQTQHPSVPLSQDVLSWIFSRPVEIFSPPINNFSPLDDLFSHPFMTPFQPVQNPYQPVQNSHQQAQNSHQQPQNSHQPAQNSHQSAQDSPQQAQNSHQSAQNSHQPAQNTHQQAQNSHQSAQNSHQPAQNSHQSAQDSPQQAQDSPQQAQNSHQSAQNSHQQAQNSHQPAQNSHQPAQNSHQQAQNSQQQAQGSNEPAPPLNENDEDSLLVSDSEATPEVVIIAGPSRSRLHRLVQLVHESHSSMGAARVRPRNTANEPTHPGLTEPTRYPLEYGGLLPPQYYQFLGHFIQHSYSTGPFLARGPINQGSFPGYYPPLRHDGQMYFPPQYEEPSEDSSSDRTPFLSALRQHALNIANEFPLGGRRDVSRESEVADGPDEQPPSDTQNDTPNVDGTQGEGDGNTTGAPSSELNINVTMLEERDGVAATPLNIDEPFHGGLREVAVEIANESRHLTMMKIGRRHKFSMKVNSEQHDNWLILALEEYFHLRVDVDIRNWGVVVYVSYIGPKCEAKNFTYEVTIDGQHNQRKLVYARTTHSDLESSSLNVSRQDCFHLTLDQALNFIRFKNRHCDAEKFLDFNVEIGQVDQAAVQREESDS